VEVMTSQGRTLGEAVRTIGVAEATCPRWCDGYGGLKLDQVRRLKERELENSRLRRAVCDLRLDKRILAEALRGNGPALCMAGKRPSRSAQSLACPGAEPARSLARRARPSAVC